MSQSLPEIPVPQPKEVAVAKGILPDVELFIKEFTSRRPYLNTKEFCDWIRRNWMYTMPRAIPKQLLRGKRMCGICSCNMSGFPVFTHPMEKCPVPKQERIRFLATNTRGVCFECLGKSESHTTCYRSPFCSQCIRNKRGERRHNPHTQQCDVGEEELARKVEQMRVEHYEHVARQSKEEPYKIQLYNDAPLRAPQQGQERAYGFPPMIDAQGRFGEVRYTEDSSYEGIIPAHRTQERAKIDKKIAEYQQTYYLERVQNGQHVPPSVKVAVEHYLIAKEKLDKDKLDKQTKEEEEKKEAEGAKVDADPKQPETIYLPSSLRIPSAEMVDNVWRDLSYEESSDDPYMHETIYESDTEKLSGQSRRLASKKEVKDFMETIMLVTPKVKAQPSPDVSVYLETEEEIREKWWMKAKEKIKAITQMPEDVKARCRQFFADDEGCCRWTAGEPEPKGEKKVATKATLKEEVEKAAFGNQSTIDKIIALQKAMTGVSDTKESIETQEPGRATAIQEEYVEFLTKIAAMLFLASNGHATKMADNGAPLAILQKCEDLVIVVPDVSLFSDTRIYVGEELLLWYSLQVAKKTQFGFKLYSKAPE